MKLTETIDECIKLASKELEGQEFDIQNYPKILKELNEKENDNEKIKICGDLGRPFLSTLWHKYLYRFYKEWNPWGAISSNLAFVYVENSNFTDINMKKES